jgi:outer membrane protein
MNKCLILKMFTVVMVMVFGFTSFAYAEAKYGYVNIAKVFDEYEKTKENDRVLQQAGRKKEEERDAIVHEVRQLKDELILLEGEAKDSKQKLLETKVQELQQFDQLAKRDLGQERSKIVREIFKDIDETVRAYGQQKAFDFIFNDRAFIYAGPKYDVTQDVLKELNKKFTKK